MTAIRTAWLLGFLALTACQPPAESEPVVAAPEPEPAVAAPAEPEPVQPPAVEPPPLKPEPPAVAAIVPPDIDPEALLNRDTAEMADLLGMPLRIEDQPPALIWVYEAANKCTLRLFFYPQLDGSRFLSLTYKIDPASDRAAEQSCLATLRRAHVG